MRPSLGYSNLYWSNKDREERRKRQLEKGSVVEPIVEEQVDFQELLDNNAEKIKPTLQEEKLVPPKPTHFPIARVER